MNEYSSSNSTDKTVEIAKKLGAEVILDDSKNFSKQREAGLKSATSSYIFYLDADERVTPELKEEIETVLKDDLDVGAYEIPRQNYYFGKYPWPYIAYFVRLFKKESLKGWKGQIHESPLYDGETLRLKGLISHYTHNDLTSMTDKTINWSDTEARIRKEANHPKMSWWRFPRVMITTFLNYYVRQKGYKLGTVGLIESVFQSYSTFITYAKLWELQNKSKGEN